MSNVYATAEPGRRRFGKVPLLLCIVTVAFCLHPRSALARQDTPRQSVNQAAAVGGFLAGAAAGLVAHEGGHLLFDVIFDADPGFRRVEFYGIPFFAITHASGLPRRQEFAISSAGFWVQHGTSEWILTRHPRLKDERAPFRKGMLAFNVGASFAYSVAAFARIGPDERDTRGMAVGARMNEPWIGAVILIPAVLDSWRYIDPDAAWPRWMSRAAKVGAVLLILR
jgi:hypothetical protein